jgi:poly(A) polymerase
MCATHNITHSTKAVILGEINRANGICQNILSGKRMWHDLFEKHTFFTEDYKYYLSIVSASRTKEAQQIWSGLVQSKVRRLVSAIELSDTGVDVAHPFNKGFDRMHLCKDEEEVNKVFQGELNFQISEEKLAEVLAAQAQTEGDAEAVENGTEPASDKPAADKPVVDKPDADKPAAGNPAVEKPTIVYTTSYYIGLKLSNLGGVYAGYWQLPLSPSGERKLDITNPVAEFKRQCTEWQQYNPELNSLRTVHTRK